MQYVVIHKQNEQADIFAEDIANDEKLTTITREHFLSLVDFPEQKKNPTVLPIQISYYAGLRIGEACALTWKDINLEEQYLTVRRSVRRNGARKRIEIETTKRNKIRTVDFGDTLSAILTLSVQNLMALILHRNKLLPCARGCKEACKWSSPKRCTGTS